MKICREHTINSDKKYVMYGVMWLYVLYVGKDFPTPTV